MHVQEESPRCFNFMEEYIRNINYNENGHCNECNRNDLIGHTFEPSSIFYCHECWEEFISDYENRVDNRNRYINSENDDSDSSDSDSGSDDSGSDSDSESDESDGDSDSDSGSDIDDDEYDELYHYENLALVESESREEYERMLNYFEDYKSNIVNSNKWNKISNNNTIYYWVRFLLEKWYVNNQNTRDIMGESINIRNGHFSILGRSVPNYYNCNHWKLEPYAGFPQDPTNLIYWINNYVLLVQ
tara:strand:- start:16216 stop:16950 length:735 start_codon:yes stop_codon:yes gene_type:complete